MSENSNGTQKNTASARAPKRNVATRGFSPQEGYSVGQSKPAESTRRESTMTSIRVNLPAGLRRDSEEIVQHLDLWSNPTEFYREAIRVYRNHWIDEARQAKKKFEEGEAQVLRGT